MLPFFYEDARHICRNAEAEVHRVTSAQFLRDPTRDDFADAEFGQFERVQRAENLA